ncbi:MAG: HsdM family class I SAM-dependent methyltransferase [Pseudonocardiaceae bacterium]
MSDVPDRALVSVREPGSSVLTRAQVARAAGVSAEAVSNWVRRHPGCLQLIRVGRQTGYSVTAVAAWLDMRPIHRDDLLPGERPGRTYGHRFREATGFAVAPLAAEGGDGSMTDRLEVGLWAPLVRLGKGSSDPDVFQAVVMSLLCLRKADPAAWNRIVGSAADTIHIVIGDIVRRQPGGLAKALDALRRIPNDSWWRHRLVQIIEIVTSQVSPGTTADRIPAAAAAFDFLLDRFAKERRRSQDQFLTPAALTRVMVSLADPGPADHVHDPCCSSGELLVAAAEHLRGKDATGPTRITGRAITPRTWRLAAMNVTVHDAQVDVADHPPRNFHEIDTGPGGYDVMVMNPPFNMADWQRPADGRPQQWPYGEPPSHNANFAWLQLAAEALAPAGRAVVLMPASAAENANPRDRDIRASLVNHGVVRCVVAFPKQLFRETTTAVTLWVLGRPSKAQDLLLIDATAATRKDRTYRTLTDQGCQSIIEVYRGWLAGSADLPMTANGVRATRATRDDIRQRNYDLHPAAYLHHHRAGAAAAASTRSLHELREDLRHLESRARDIDHILNDHLDRILPWTH